MILYLSIVLTLCSLLDHSFVFLAVFREVLVHKYAPFYQVRVFPLFFGAGPDGIVFKEFQHRCSIPEFVLSAELSLTLGEDLHNREPFVFNGLFEYPLNLQDMIGGGSAHKGSTRGPGNFNHVKGLVYVAVRRGCSLDTASRQRGKLPAGHAVDTIVHNNSGEINIAAAGMDKMVASNRHAVPVSHRDQHIQFRLAKFYPGSKSQGPAVQGMQRMKIDVSGHPG